MCNPSFIKVTSISLCLLASLLSNTTATANCRDTISKFQGPWIGVNDGRKVEIQISGIKIRGFQEGNSFGHNGNCQGKIRSTCKVELKCYAGGGAPNDDLTGVFPNLKNSFEKDVYFKNPAYEKYVVSEKKAKLARAEKERVEQNKIALERSRLEEERLQIKKERARIAAEKKAIQKARIAVEKSKRQKAVEKRAPSKKEIEIARKRKQEKKARLAKQRAEAEAKRKSELAAIEKNRKAEELAEQKAREESARHAAIAAQEKERKKREMAAERAKAEQERQAEIAAINKAILHKLKTDPLTKLVFADQDKNNWIFLVNETGLAGQAVRGLSGEIKFENGKANFCSLTETTGDKGYKEYIDKSLKNSGITSTPTEFGVQDCSDLSNSTVDLAILQAGFLEQQSIEHKEAIADLLFKEKYAVYKVIKHESYQALIQKRDRESKRIADQVANGSIKGHGLLITRKNGNGIFCAESVNNDAILGLAEELNETLGHEYRQQRVDIKFSDLEGSFISIKRNKCQFFIGNETSLKTIGSALVRDRLEPRFHHVWIEGNLSKYEKVAQRTKKTQFGLKGENSVRGESYGSLVEKKATMGNSEHSTDEVLKRLKEEKERLEKDLATLKKNNSNRMSKSRDNSSTPKREFANYRDGNEVIERCADAMTIEKRRCKEKSIGNTFVFLGEVFDIISPSAATVKLYTEEGNYSDVIFRSAEVENYRKGVTIKFNGILRSVGTGIMTHHRITGAQIVRK